MNNRQIACFLEIAKELNFTKAAENLFLPQPAVSRYIAALEEELDTKLFIRESNRKIYLSEAGKTYFNMFLRFSREFQETQRLLHAKIQPLRLGHNIGWNLASFLPDILTSCQVKHPDFSVSVTCHEPHDLFENLAAGLLDAVFTIENYPEHKPGIELERITTVRRVVTYSSRLPGYETISSPADFYSYDFFLVDDPLFSRISQDMEQYFRPYNFMPKIKPAPNMGTVFSNVENGLGVALFDLWGRTLSENDMHYVEMDSDHPICLAWNSGANTASIQALKTALYEYFSTSKNN